MMLPVLVAAYVVVGFFVASYGLMAANGSEPARFRNASDGFAAVVFWALWPIVLVLVSISITMEATARLMQKFRK